MCNTGNVIVKLGKSSRIFKVRKKGIAFTSKKGVKLFEIG